MLPLVEIAAFPAAVGHGGADGFAFGDQGVQFRFRGRQSVRMLFVESEHGDGEFGHGVDRMAGGHGIVHVGGGLEAVSGSVDEGVQDLAGGFAVGHGVTSGGGGGVFRRMGVSAWCAVRQSDRRRRRPTGGAIL